MAGQEAGDFQAKIRASMSASLEKQKASVQRQASSAQVVAPNAASDNGAAGFFTVPWPAPVNMNVALPANADCDAMPKDQLDVLVNKAAAQEGVGTDLIKAVIHKESAAKPCAVSSKGAQGLMQLMPATAAQLGVGDAFDPKQN